MAGLFLLPNTSSRNANAQQERDILFFNGDPAWSPDGTRIAFVSGRSGNYDIWVMNADGSDPQNLTNSEAIDLAPQWDPNGQFIAYISAPSTARPLFLLAGTTLFDVWVSKSDGSEPINLTVDFQGLAGAFEWSPDGQHLAFVVQNGTRLTDMFWRVESSELWVTRPDGSDSANLVSRSDYQFDSVDWNPDGSMIAIVAASFALNDSAIWIKHFASTEPPFSTDLDGDETQVKWSPNADNLAVVTSYASNGGLMDIWIVNPLGQKAVNLTPDNPGLDWKPVWSSDGQYIAFESDRTAGRFEQDIWRMDADGSNKMNLTPDLYQQEGESQWHMNIGPDWSLDGSQIVFQSYYGDYFMAGWDGQSDIWIMNADGTNKINLTKSASPDG